MLQGCWFLLCLKSWHSELSNFWNIQDSNCTTSKFRVVRCFFVIMTFQDIENITSNFWHFDFSKCQMFASVKLLHFESLRFLKSWSFRVLKCIAVDILNFVYSTFHNFTICKRWNFNITHAQTIDVMTFRSFAIYKKK